MRNIRILLPTGIFIISLLASLLLVVAPAMAESTAQYKPTITKVTPSATYRGMPVVIEGKDFCACQLEGFNKVTFNGVDAGKAILWCNDTIVVIVPEGATSGPLVVTTIAGVSNAYPFTVLESPTSMSCYAAEGTTRAGFEEWLTLYNPWEETQLASVTYLIADAANRFRYYDVPPHTRLTIYVNSEIGSDKDVSVAVTSTAGLFVERPMYFRYKDKWTGGHDTVLALQPSTTWYFAEGTTRAGFEEWLCLANPGVQDAQVNVTYIFADGETATKGYVVPALKRYTIDVNDAVGPEKDVALKVESNLPLVAERPMYFNYRSVWDDGHIALGATSPSTTWYFAEGTTRAGFEEWLCLANPGVQDAQVRLVYHKAGEEDANQEITVPAGRRRTVYVNDVIGQEKDVAIEVESDVPVVAERPMYFNYRYQWNGGHITMGAPSPSTAWYFAEGTTRAGFEEWLCLANPGDVEAGVSIEYAFQDGTTQGQELILAPGQRFTIFVNEVVGPEKDVAVKVQSNQGIVAERPMYFYYHGLWDGGSTTTGFTGFGL